MINLANTGKSKRKYRFMPQPFCCSTLTNLAYFRDALSHATSAPYIVALITRHLKYSCLRHVCILGSLQWQNVHSKLHQNPCSSSRAETFGHDQPYMSWFRAHHAKNAYLRDLFVLWYINKAPSISGATDSYLKLSKLQDFSRAFSSPSKRY
jgi:hypothetical protein